MPYVALFMKATLENVREIHFPENTEWTLDVSASNGIDTREGVTINAQDEFEVPNSKGTANFLIKWEGAKQPSTISMVTLSRKTEIKDKEIKNATLGEYPEGASGNFSPIAIFDCRGAEPSKWHPKGPFRVTSTGGATWEDVDLTDADGWCEYDEKNELSVTISDVAFEFRAVK
eukprot:TRINITY_DN30542_c0_g1_i1.p1 TRINITY_DN30542_c0_g1~~TRINITY_DN30542_c0_g1_i1.p1  ORF type:complete len:198 (-),score=54.43 TRINITY_DN30542_c0_g1_i1:257-778(-)